MPLLSNRSSLRDLLGAPTPKLDPPSHPTSLRPPTPPSPLRPRSEYGLPTSRLSHEVRLEDLVHNHSTSHHDPRSRDARPKRFSLMRFRNYSESHLSVKAREFDAHVDIPTVPHLPRTPPQVPAILKTAPTMEATHDRQRHGEQGAEVDGDDDDEGGLEMQSLQNEAQPQRRVRTSLFKRSASKGRTSTTRTPRESSDEKGSGKKSLSMKLRSMHPKSPSWLDSPRLSDADARPNLAPPSYGDETNSALALPVSDPRFSDSSRSDGSNASSEQIYGSTTTTTHTVSTHTTFFKLPRRNPNRNSLFPLPVKIPPPHEEPQFHDEPTTPRASTGAISTKSLQTPNGKPPFAAALPRRHTDASTPTKPSQQHPPLPASNVLAKQSLSFAEPGMTIGRNDSQESRASTTSSPLQPPMRINTRGRASTASSLGRNSHDLGSPPPFVTGSGRNSTSTTGRSSLGGLLTLSRFRQSSDPHSPRHGSPGTNSHSNSFAMSREALVVPEREEGDTPGKYLERLENAVARSMIAGILSKSSDPFAQSVLRSYTRRFPFFGEPIDMSLRKLLLEAELPKETQQVDRVIQAFADRYHECNPGIFTSPDRAYIIAFSLMMLHTDAFNKNNKHKMQKQDYIKNTSGQQVSEDVLGCFYDNICYTPFVHYEEEVDINGERVLPFKTKKGKIKGTMADTGKKPTGPLDPYNLLVEQKLDALRPAIKEHITIDDPYNYTLSQNELDPQYLQRAFTHTGVLQIISARSRPTAYEGNLTNVPDPNETEAGIIDLKITKVGTLWRKAPKKKKARSPWQEWGAILTGSQLYLFKNAHWAKGLMHQFKDQQSPGQPRIPVVFKPPLQEFKPDALIKTDNAVALVDGTYNRHKHAFLFVRPGGQDEVLLADNENELHDWLALINYAAAFRAAGVRIRGMVGGTEEDLRSRDVRRVDSTSSNRSLPTVQTAHGEMIVQNRGLSPQIQRQVMAARRQIMVQKMSEAGKEISDANKQLDNLLRNARHLLVLAPIAPRTREEVIHAAARADAMIKWTRRDIWRLKCHKDILAMDVQQDDLSASELQALTGLPAVESSPETAQKSRPKGLSRFNSKASAARSPPQSPKSPVYASRPSISGRPSLAGRPSMADSVDTYPGNDVFRTPPETATTPREADWRLPPLQLDAQSQEQHRGSTTSTHLTASSAGQASLSHASSYSSMYHTERLLTTEQISEAESRGREASIPSIGEREVEMMARTTMDPEPMEMEPVSSRKLNLDGTPINTTPEGKHRGGVRRSLQKTLRDAHPSSTHRHKKNKESDATIRSGAVGPNSGAATNGDKDEEAQDGTPGLKRGNGRFLLHGKQASVVQFGSDWPNDRMKMRREVWHQNSHSPSRADDDARLDATGYASSGAGGAERDASTPSAQWTTDDDDHNNAGAVSSGGDEDSIHSAHSDGFRQDAEAAEAFATASAEHRSSQSYFDGVAFAPSAWSPNPKRNTVIGPGSVAAYHRRSGLAKGDDGMVVSETEAEDEDAAATHRARLNRSTVIGPSIRIVGTTEQEESDTAAGGSASDAAAAVSGAEDDSAALPIGDEELRVLSMRDGSSGR